MAAVAPDGLDDIDYARLYRARARASEIAYIRAVAPWFTIEEIHCVIASHHEALMLQEIDRLMVFMPPRTGKPVADDQLVLRGDGQRIALRDIQVGDLVVTAKGRARRVEAVHIQGALQTVAITTRSGRQVVAALDHPILTARGWVEAGKVTPADVLGIPNGCETVAQSRRLHEFRLAGYFTGDGSTTTNGPSFNSAITCFDPVEAADIQDCARAMGFTLGRSKRVTAIPIGGGCRNWLRQRGMAGVKSIHKRAPAFVFGGSNEEIANFIGAYFACDGSIFRKSKGRAGWTIEFGSASHGLLEDVQHLLMRLGIGANLTRRNSKDHLGRPYPSSRLTLYSENETAKFAQRIPVHGVKTLRLAQVGPQTAFDGSYLPDPVADIRDGGVRPCRCLTVADDATFLAGDLVVHNSQMGSIFLPSMWAGHHPTDQILQIGHSVELSRKFSTDVRSIMRSRAYDYIFPGVTLAKDNQALGRWRVEDTMSEMEELEKTGEYNAAGVTSSIAGKGFHLGVLDDAQSEQDKDSKITKDRLKNWWGPGFYTRRMPERNAILINATRWGTDDLPGHILELEKKHREISNERHHGADVWTQCNIPAILDRDSAKKVYEVAKAYGQIADLQHLKEGDSFAPRRWSLRELARSRANCTDREWDALYLGKPSLDEGHILKRKYWRLWPKEKPPVCLFVFQMYDTAFDDKAANDKSARTTWGIFEHKEREGERPTLHMILLEAWDDRVEAPMLKRHVLVSHWGGKEAKKALEEMYPQDPDIAEGIDETAPAILADRILIENKASGLWLIKELRRIRKPKPMPIWPFALPRGSRGGAELSKFARAHMGSLVLEQGAVWYMNRKWAETVIDKCAACQFLGQDADADLADTVTASMIYVRQTYRVEVGSDIDEEEEKRANKRTKPRQFYGARQA